jgi:hypothetical protein
MGELSYVFAPTVSGKNLKKAEMLTWKQETVH